MQHKQSRLQESYAEEDHPEVVIRSLNHLFAMAQRYRSEGALRQAMEIFWRLSEDHPDTRQGQGALGSLLELADDYEGSGSRHQARAIYERLL